MGSSFRLVVVALGTCVLALLVETAGAQGAGDHTYS